MVKRILFVINRSSATGYSDATINRLCSALSRTLMKEADLDVEVVDDHPDARVRTETFMAVSDAPALVIAGGGGGTLRAVIEGICKESGNLPGRERVRLASLRMGSGNMLAKQLGMPCDVEAGLKGIMANLYENRTVPCCVMRCEVGKKDSGPETHYAVTMGGFGQFGCSPGDLVRWHQRLPTLRKLLARGLGIERLNTLEYSLSLFIRSVRCALWSHAVEVVEIHTGGRIESIRLLAGVVMNFQSKTLPFESGIRMDETALSLHFIPYPGRWSSLLLVISPRRLARKALHIRVADSDLVEVCLVNRDAAEFFLDEDPVVFHGRVMIRVAGILAFVPGPDYRRPQERKDYP